MIDELMLLSGIDIPIPEIQTIIHQPTIKEIAMIGELDFFSIIQTICFNKDTIIAASSNLKDNFNLRDMNDFQIFMMLIADPQMKDKAKRQNGLLSVFTVLFPGYKTTILPNSIYFVNSSTKSNFVIDENNFDVIKTAISEISGLNSIVGGQNAGFNPKGNKAAEIAAKLMAGRAEVLRQKGEGSGASKGIFPRYASIISIGLKMDLNAVLNYTPYQIYDIMERYGLYISYDIDIRSRLAGGKPDNKPDDWMKEIH